MSSTRDFSSLVEHIKSGRGFKFTGRSVFEKVNGCELPQLQWLVRVKPDGSFSHQNELKDYSETTHREMLEQAMTPYEIGIPSSVLFEKVKASMSCSAGEE